ncbi:MAG TPA: S-layer homology domain-containing protein [Candidatus Ornithomonoglobus intestinigallinarum]|uniref:S-layer homology domain-containing protein n=1 Tax=Candidatus Ornithomonoglobus intestinigallinarum TaxID=2840894 RepID=A0A9D1KQD8_9FIRM|nr:S-layer homology domain-containing protein [Candidatus Ornithomonoglobus intestinigallinarum]
MSHRPKKIAAAVICAVMAIQSVGFAALKRDPDFPDLADHWSKSIVMRLNGYGIINGYEDGTMRPDADVSVAEYLTMMIKALGFTPESDGSGYWAQPYIDKAIELGLIENGEISDYSAPITRNLAAKIVVNSLKDTTVADENAVKSKIYDYAEIPEEYKPYIVVAYDKQLVNGDHNNCFGGSRNITRAEASVITVRLIDKNGGIQQNPGTITDPGTQPGGGTMVASAALYVATNGNDNSDGSEGAPFATIQKAKDTIREMKAAGALPEGGVTVYLRGGTYYIDEGMTFTEEDSGTEDSVITYTAYPGEAVTLSGQAPLEASWFEPADDEAKDIIIDQKAADKVLMVDLAEHGITDYGEMNTRGYHYFNKGLYAPAELVVNGENQTLARYPNEGTISVPTENVDAEAFGFKYTDERVSKWKDAKEGYITGTISINYENNTYPIDTIDTAQKLLTIKEGRINTYYTNGWFFGQNLLEEIDMEGEYYIDRETGVLYYYPPEDFETGDYEIGVTQLEQPIFNFNGAEYITVSNFTMDGGRGYAVLGASAGYEVPSFRDWLVNSQGSDLNGANYTKGSGSSVYIADVNSYTESQLFPGHVWDGFTDEGDGVNGIEVKNCNIFNFGGGAIVMNGTNVHLNGNHIKNTGGTALYLRGGDLETLEASGNTIENNEIHRVGYLERAYVPAIGMHGVGIHVAHNDIYDAPHCIFNYHGNDHIIEYNKIHDAVKECLDMDAIYTRNEYMPQWRGNIIRNNYIYNLGIFPVGEYTKQLNVSGIRTDNYGHALQIYNNIFANIGTAGANNVIGITAQGNRNQIKGNMFIDCSATYLGWTTYTAGATWDMNNAEEKERVELAEHYASIPIFAEKYPELATFRDEYYKSVATNVFDENVVINLKFPLSTTNGTVNPQSTRGAVELIKGDNNYVSEEDPGFVDYSNGNYELKSDSQVFKQIPEFQNVDMEEFGPTEPVGPIN